MTDFATQIINAWVAKIQKKMTERGSSSVEFVAGTDFELTEESWIRKKLCPALAAHGMRGYVSNYRRKGEISGCDCWASDCEHTEGRKFVVSLVTQ